MQPVGTTAGPVGCSGNRLALRSGAGATAEVWLRDVAPSRNLCTARSLRLGTTTKWPSLTMENQAVSATRAARPRSARKARAAPHHAGPLTLLHLVCEATGKNFDYEVPNDAGALKDLWDRRLMVSCPHCRQDHTYLFRTAYVRAVLDDPGRRPLGRL